MLNTRSDSDILEDVMDKHGLAATVAMLAEICRFKAEHVATNWQDASTAKQWMNHAATLDTAITKEEKPMSPLDTKFAEIVELFTLRVEERITQRVEERLERNTQEIVENMLSNKAAVQLICERLTDYVGFTDAITEAVEEAQNDREINADDIEGLDDWFRHNRTIEAENVEDLDEVIDNCLDKKLSEASFRKELAQAVVAGLKIVAE